MKTVPDFNTLPEFYKNYVMQVHEMDLTEALTRSMQETQKLVSALPESLGEFRYAEGKWSIKELLCHIIDAERIFCYRALRFARKDGTPLSPFEENDYATQANAHGRTLAQILNEMKNLRVSTMDMFSSFTPDMLQLTGTASGKLISVINLGYIIAGHEAHHLRVLQERYLKK